MQCATWRRGAGNDSGMSCHIERKTADGKPHIPSNADESRTHLNRELITLPKAFKTAVRRFSTVLRPPDFKEKSAKTRPVPSVCF